MKHFISLFDFYTSKEWAKFRKTIIMDRLDEDGNTIDEITGKPIVRAYDIILHHIVPLTEENVNDYMISLNPENIQIVSHKTHNILHDRLGLTAQKQVFLVYGAPMSGKSSYVKGVMSEGDLIVDMDSIWQCVSGLDRYKKPNKLKAVVFHLEDTLLDIVKYRDGKWHNAYVIGGFPLLSERERTLKELHAREVFIECDKQTCLERLRADKERDSEWEKYINDWFEKYGKFGQ